PSNLLCRSHIIAEISHEAFLGGDWSLQAEYIRANVRATALEGEIYVVKDISTGRILSSGLWFEPGRGLFGTEAQRALGYDTFFEKLSPETKEWTTHTELEAQMWWCFCLGTEPDFQGRGLATALVDAVYAMALSKQGFIGLSTPTELNVAKYRSMGFRERGRTWLDTPKGGFPAIMLSRDAPA
ncbi:hypothetical protein FA95DRAFT_1482179, partial [Auriscalpium vulgare]